MSTIGQQVLADALLAMVRDSAGALAGGARYLADVPARARGGKGISAAEALKEGRDLASPIDYSPTDEAQQAEAALMQAIMGSDAVQKIAGSRPVQALGEYASENPNVMAGVEMAAAPLDFLPGGGLVEAMAGLPLLAKAAKGGRKVALEKIWEGADLPEAQKIAQRGEHLRRDKEGQYIGGPRGMDSPQKLAAVRKNADELVQEGAHGMGWYDKARKTFERFAPGKPEMQDLAVRGTSAYSPQATPPTEVGAFAKQHNAKVLTGEDVAPRTKAQARNVARGYEGGPGDVTFQPQRVKLGEKTGPYSDAKNPTIDPDSLYKTANDIWHARVMGYGEDFQRGLSPTEHAYLTGENLRLADRAKARDAAAGIERDSEWTPRSAQAATWVAKREEKYVNAAKDKHAKELKRVQRENAKRERQNVKLQEAGKKPRKLLKEPVLDEAALLKQARDYSGAGIPEAFERNTGHITSEARTGASVGHLPMDDPAEIGAYTDLVRDQTAKRAPTLDDLQMYSANARPTEGVYKNSLGEIERNPGWAREVLLSADLKGAPKTPEIEKAAMGMDTLIEAIGQAQEAGAWSRFFPEGMGKQKAGEMNAVLTRDKPQAPIEGTEQVNYPESSLLFQLDSDYNKVQGQTGGLQDALAAAGLDRGVRGTMESEYIPTNLALMDNGQRVREPGSGDATAALLDRLGKTEAMIPNYAERTAGGVSKKMQAMNEIDRMVQASSGKPVREDLMKLRGILGEGGLPALREYVAKHGTKGLPAVVLGMLGLQAAGAGAPQQGDM